MMMITMMMVKIMIMIVGVMCKTCCLLELLPNRDGRACLLRSGCPTLKHPPRIRTWMRIDYQATKNSDR